MLHSKPNWIYAFSVGRNSYPHAGTGYRLVLVVVAIVTLLVGCSGRQVPQIIETPAPETPGPVTPAEDAYYQAVQTYQGRLAELYIKLIGQVAGHLNTVTAQTQIATAGVASPPPTVDDTTWQQQSQETAVQMQKLLDDAQAISVPPRLAAIDVHLKEGIVLYQEALDVYKQKLTQTMADPVLRDSWYRQFGIANGKLSLTLGLLDSFRSRHPSSK